MLYWLNSWNQGVTRVLFIWCSIDITRLSVQSRLKYLITEISEKDLLVLFLYYADHNSKSLYFKNNKK